MKFTHPYLREKSYLKTNLSDARYCIVPKGQRLWQNEHFLAGILSFHFQVTCFFPQQIHWIKYRYAPLPTKPNDIQQVHLCPCNATQGQVSGCEATAIHSSSPNISHLRLLLDHGYLQHPNFVSTAIVQQLTPRSSTAFHGHWCSFKKDSDTKSETNPEFNKPKEYPQ